MNIGSFNTAALEKVRHLLTLLDAIYHHPFLRERVCLHGGTALNLFVLDTPRLSVDIDLNYIGSSAREVMQKERPLIDKSLHEVARRLRSTLSLISEEHSGATYKLKYGTGNSFVKVDVNYLNRSPILPPVLKRYSFGEDMQVDFPVNDDREIFAGKTKALLERVVPRDLYDVYRISSVYDEAVGTDEVLARRVMLYYVALSQPFPRPLHVRERFDGHEGEVETNLYPMLRADDRPGIDTLISIAEEFVKKVSAPQTDCEAAFLAAASNGEFSPELLFADYPECLSAAQCDPAMAWKMLNLRKCE